MKLPRFGLRSRDTRDTRDTQLDDEIRAHFELAVHDAARREFGNIGHVKEVTREMWGGLWFERLAGSPRRRFSRASNPACCSRFRWSRSRSP